MNRAAVPLVAGLVLAVVVSPAPGQEKPLGWLSRKHEVGNRGPETVSTGKLANGKDALRALVREEAERPLQKTVFDDIGKGVGIIATPDRRAKNKDLVVPRGQTTFDAEGQGAGLSGAEARKFLDDHSYGALLKSAMALGLKGTEVNDSIKANSLDELTLPQQKKLFELTYERFEAEVKKKFPDYEKYPPTAQEAVTDMAYNLGMAGLAKKFPKFVAAVEGQDWPTAAAESKRKGVGATRNEQTRKLLEAAAEQKGSK